MNSQYIYFYILCFIVLFIYSSYLEQNKNNITQSGGNYWNNLFKKKPTTNNKKTTTTNKAASASASATTTAPNIPFFNYFQPQRVVAQQPPVVPTMMQPVVQPQMMQPQVVNTGMQSPFGSYFNPQIMSPQVQAKSYLNMVNKLQNTNQMLQQQVAESLPTGFNLTNKYYNIRVKQGHGLVSCGLSCLLFYNTLEYNKLENDKRGWKVISANSDTNEVI